MDPRIRESVRRRLLEALSACTTSEFVAIATEFGIRNEAALRRLVAATGRLRSSQLRPAADAATHETRLDSTAVGGASGGGRRPAVNWHSGGDGPTLLLLNGWSASGLVWPEAWLRRLEDRHHVIRIDNRGSGWSRSAAHPFTISDLARDARDVLRVCGIERASILGVSMGGMIAQELAIRHGDMVDRLILAATRPPSPGQVAQSLEAMLTMMKRPGQTDALREFFTTTWTQTAGDALTADRDDIVEELADQILQRVTPRSGVINQARAILAWHGPHRLRRISAPTTVVHGTRDPLIPVTNGRRLAALIPDATYVELEGIGHLVPQEAGDVLLELLDT